MKVKLVVVQGKPQGMEILLRDAKFLIGRGPECHLRPNSELVSRHHCMFVIENDCLLLRDLGSTNGTVVNGERVTGTVPVFHEDLVQVGAIGFRVMLDPVPSSSRMDFESHAASLTVSSRSSSKVANTSAPPTRNDGVVEQWLDGDPARGPSAPPDVEQNMQGTTVETEGRQDTQHELPRHQ